MKKWQRKEIRDAQAFNGRRTPGSGNKSGFKGDVKSSKFLFECKQTTKKGFRITNQMWDKAYSEALLSDRIPAMSIELSNGKELIVLDKNDFIELTNMLQ